MQRTIMIFPKFENMAVIDEIREKYDPLSSLVAPHITLVFTFESDLSVDQLESHLRRVLEHTKKFDLTMNRIVPIDNELGKYLFLLIDKGEQHIKDISRNLYSGLLKPYKADWLNDTTYLPHMTLGTFSSKDALEEAYEETKKLDIVFETLVDQIAVEIIAEDESSIVDIVVDLKV